MSKIIIHNNSIKTDKFCCQAVFRVLVKGFISGHNQYCWLTTFKDAGIQVHAKKTRGTTHTFEVRDL